MEFLRLFRETTAIVAPDNTTVIKIWLTRLSDIKGYKMSYSLIIALNAKAIFSQIFCI